jgi:hypothetical protein
MERSVLNILYEAEMDFPGSEIIYFYGDNEKKIKKKRFCPFTYTPIRDQVSAGMFFSLIMELP